MLDTFVVGKNEGRRLQEWIDSNTCTFLRGLSEASKH